MVRDVLDVLGLVVDQELQAQRRSQIKDTLPVIVFFGCCSIGNVEDFQERLDIRRAERSRSLDLVMPDL